MRTLVWTSREPVYNAEQIIWTTEEAVETADTEDSHTNFLDTPIDNLRSLIERLNTQTGSTTHRMGTNFCPVCNKNRLDSRSRTHYRLSNHQQSEIAIFRTSILPHKRQKSDQGSQPHFILLGSSWQFS